VKSANAPIQIMGVRESAGLRFSHCRVLGMNDDIWPPSPRPTAFIPLRLQRQAGVTAALPERFLGQVREQTARLFLAAEDLIFTCSASDGDRELLPSPMLSSLELSDKPTLQHGAIHFLAGRDRPRLQHLDDTQATAVEDDETVHGGTSVISLQSACPFRAFAELRLKASQPESVEHGVRALDRGNLIHTAMEHLWKEIKTHERLMALSDSALRDLLHEVIGKALEKQTSLGTRRIADHLVEAERECMLLLLNEWIQIEKARLPFEVKDCEAQENISVAGLKLSMRADRIDTLSDGSELLIDYKSGKKSVADWMSLRPSEPQIPLYLQARDTNLRAVAFAVLRRGESHFAGLRDDDVPIDELAFAAEYLAKREIEEHDWAALRLRWTSILEGLAKEFLSGHAAVRPRDGADTCKWCKLSAFCRIDSSDNEETGDENE
jgi:probable DNA repair protein